ncbi:fibulin-5 [Polypterus senegalus]|uniref:fibulin-5 n=1 Tax=Polypterus senegalus TaxID=55291 RepID=UPI0019651103|nr:fibulin-5 [Polypterus senegalus]
MMTSVPAFPRMLLPLLLVLLLHHHGGHAQQTCSDGFHVDRQTRQCIDIDECRTIPNACRGEMQCINQNGGYLCIPRSMFSQTYPRPNAPSYPGMTYPNSYPPPPAPVPAPSYPSSGQPVICRFGYTLSEGNECVDIDECVANSHQCNPTQICINTEGGYTCSCTDGYWLVEGQCLDIDECRYGYCHQLCANIPGSYSCTCNPGFILNPDGRSCQDVDECEGENSCEHGCMNTYGSFICRCNAGFELGSDGLTCTDLDECSYSNLLCQHQCVNQPGSFFCICPPGYTIMADGTTCQDINECETGNATCTRTQECFNYQGGYKCLDPVRCEEPYILFGENRCMCQSENPGCRDKPFTVLYKFMDIAGGRTVPLDVFQMQATTRYPGVYFIFQIKSGNEGREFYMRQTGPYSATLVLTRPLSGPKDVVLDLEMVTVHTVINFRGSSVIRLTVFVSEFSY